MQIEFRPEVNSPLESVQETAGYVGKAEVNLYLCVSSGSADCLQCYFGREGIQQFGFDEVYPCVFLSQPSPYYAQETQQSGFSSLSPQHMVS
jgi:hypothetical protein